MLARSHPERACKFRCSSHTQRQATTGECACVCEAEVGGAVHGQERGVGSLSPRCRGSFVWVRSAVCDGGACGGTGRRVHYSWCVLCLCDRRMSGDGVAPGVVWCPTAAGSMGLRFCRVGDGDVCCLCVRGLLYVRAAVLRSLWWAPPLHSAAGVPRQACRRCLQDARMGWIECRTAARPNLSSLLLTRTWAADGSLPHAHSFSEPVVLVLLQRFMSGATG